MKCWSLRAKGRSAGRALTLIRGSSLTPIIPTLDPKKPLMCVQVFVQPRGHCGIHDKGFWTRSSDCPVRAAVAPWKQLSNPRRMKEKELDNIGYVHVRSAGILQTLLLKLPALHKVEDCVWRKLHQSATSRPAMLA